MATPDALASIPAVVQIGPYAYAVSAEGDYTYEHNVMGTVLHRSCRIVLDPLQANTELPQTLLHEILHALGTVLEIPGWEKHTKDEKGEDTDQINLMATVLLMWLRANPDVVRWMVSPAPKPEAR
jgi:hypothetical protein